MIMKTAVLIAILTLTGCLNSPEKNYAISNGLIIVIDKDLNLIYAGVGSWKRAEISDWEIVRISFFEVFTEYSANKFQSNKKERLYLSDNFKYIKAVTSKDISWGQGAIESIVETEYFEVPKDVKDRLDRNKNLRIIGVLGNP
jgi:hypothetical protein